MTNNEGGYDYAKLARPGEVKKTQPLTPPKIAPTRNETLKSAQPDQERFQGDLRDSISGSVRRLRQGNEISLPITDQPDMQGTPDLGVTNVDGTRSLSPTDELIQQSLDGYQDTNTLRKARRRGFAVTDSIIKAAEKRKK